MESGSRQFGMCCPTEDNGYVMHYICKHNVTFNCNEFLVFMATKKFESYEVNKYLIKQKHAPKQLIRTFDAGAKKIIGIFKVAHWGPNARVEFAF